MNRTVNIQILGEIILILFYLYYWVLWYIDENSPEY